ncbi:MAG: amidohydrolase family protein [Cyclobacteriaceae bacterium]
MKLNLRLLAALVFLITGYTATAQRTLIHAGKLIDGVSDKVKKEMTIVVEDDRITSIEKGYTKADGSDKVIDLKNMTVMPGLIDMHVHLENQTSPDNYTKRFLNNEADIAFSSLAYAKNTLMAGFTTVRDVGGTGVNIALRNAINRGLVEGPRVFTSGKSIATTGGHADPTNGMKKELMGNPGPAEGVVNGPAEARRAVRQRYKNGADMIKITATGGVLSVAKDGSGPQFRMDELEAIIETANDYGMHVAAHAHGAEGMKRAVMAGVTTIEHGSYMTEEVMDLMKEKGTYLVPTLTAGRTVADSAKVPGYYPAIVVPKALAVGPQIQGTFAKAYKRGVNIVFGTDAGVFIHGFNGREFELMVEGGMPAMEAIQAATSVAAKVLGQEENFGSLEEGKYADIVATPENPVDNISTMNNVGFVMKGGKVYKSSAE